MAAAVPPSAWEAAFARRSRGSGGAITAILALAGAKDVIAFSGGFPAAETFPADLLTGLTSQLLAEDAAVALQYSPTEGLESVRDAVAQRLQAADGRRPADAELMITSGGIDGLELVCKSLLETGDVAVVEDPSYLGAIMAFRGFDAEVVGIPMDADGMDVEALGELLAGGLRPKVLYTIPEHQNPTGLALSLPRRETLLALCREHRILILEDVAYRELRFAGDRLPSLWSMAPDVVVQLGTFSKTFFPGVRLGWAAAPAPVIAHMVTAKQNTDQCAGALGQRLLEEYLRGGHLDRQLVDSRALYARRCALMMQALADHMPGDVTWTQPDGGFFTWVTLGEHVDTVQLAPRASAEKVAYVPGTPFRPGPGGRNELRLAYSGVTDTDITEGVARLSALIMRP